MALQFTDTSQMPFGEHKGKQLQDVPDSYLAWVWSENKEDYLAGKITWDKKQALMVYIEDNLDSIDLNEED